MIMFKNAGKSLRSLVPLVLHKIVCDKPSDWEDVHEKEFKKLLDFVGHRWAVFRPDGREEARWMITFDDGNISDYDIVFPALIERNMQATFFLITDRIGVDGYVNWSQIKEMHDHGMCIGSHSRTHRRMTSLSANEAMQEFSVSKQQLEDFLGAPVESFSYPFGESSPKLHQIGFDAGYSYICTSGHGITSALKNPVPRNSINSAMSWDGILKMLEPTVSKRFIWYAEDRAKETLKRVVGHENYIRWRNRALGLIR